MADMFEFLKRMNKGDFDWLASLSDEDVKSLSPYVLLMWCHGANSNTPIHVIMTDQYCNQKVFPLYKHPRLVLQLFFAANADIDNTRYSFVKSISSEKSKNTKILAEYLNCGYDEAKDYIEVLGDKFKNIAKQLEGK